MSDTTSLLSDSGNVTDNTLAWHRDVDARLTRDVTGATRHPELAVRREDEERSARGGPCELPQDRRAQSDPDQHQVRRRWTQPHLREPGRQVRTRFRSLNPRARIDVNAYSMDLSWNFAAESQAYDRVHRLGQEKDVFVKRLVVEETIEERMLRLQDVKMGTLWSDWMSLQTKDVNVLSRVGRCGARRGNRGKATQAQCQRDQSRALLYPLVYLAYSCSFLALRNGASAATSSRRPSTE